MPLTLPDLDDRRFDDLVAEAKALIPSLAPQWTDHNPSDPGIALVELFAWLSETLMYRIDRITPASTHAFLRLLNGPEWTPSADGDLGGDIRATVTAMRRCDRAVTTRDFETLAQAADPRVARVRAVARCNLAADDPLSDAPAHVSVVLLPAGGGQPPPDLLAAVAAYLEPRRMITTRLQVVGPRFVKVGVRMTLTMLPDAVPAGVRAAAIAALGRYFDPLHGGDGGKGWPFGRSVHTSEIYRLLAQVPGVDYVDATAGTAELTTPDASRLVVNGDDGLVGVRLGPDELPAFDSGAAALVTVYPPGRQVAEPPPTPPARARRKKL